MDCLIGLDIGTSAVKGVLLSVDGKILNTVTNKYRYYYENNIKCLKPEEFVGVCKSTVKELATADKDRNVLAVCSCCASGNLIILDKENKPITPIIGWQNKISKEDKDTFFTKEEQEDFYNIVGWPLSGYFPACYLAYIKMYKPQLLVDAGMITMSAEYLNFTLTGKFGMSVSMGTPFFLLNQEKGEYNKPLIDKFGISEDKLPPIFDKGTVLGTVLPEVAEELGLSTDTKIVLGSFDHPSGAMGAGVFDEGQMLLSCGTSWVEFFPVKSREFAISTGGLVDRFMLDGSPYCVMKSITSVSEKIDALREHYLGKISHKEFDELAVKSELGSNALKFSLTDEDFNIADGYSKSDIARAIIESAGYVLKENLKEIEKSGLVANSVTMIGGISNSKVCVDIVSEVLEKPVNVVNGQSAGAVGACLLAGIGIGLYDNEKIAFATLKL